VADGWGSVVAQLVPLALVITASPLSVIPAVLVLHTPRPRPTSFAFLAGWVFGLAALTVAFVGLSELLGGAWTGLRRGHRGCASCLGRR
jgi:hypothetical protein